MPSVEDKGWVYFSFSLQPTGGTMDLVRQVNGCCIHGSHEIQFSTVLGKSPLPCCVTSARLSHLPVISHPLVISFCVRDYNQLRR